MADHHITPRSAGSWDQGHSYYNRPVVPFSAGSYKLKTQEWSTIYAFMDETPMSDNEFNISATRLTLNLPDQNVFTFTAIESNKFYIQSKQWPGKYLYMPASRNGNVKGMNGVPEADGRWIVQTRDDGSITMATEAWPNWYMVMSPSNDNVQGHIGYPGSDGRWIPERVN